jgi:hypothetical protein
MGNNFLLEVLNGNWGIAGGALTIICGFYLAHETFALKVLGWGWRKRITRGMRVATAVMTSSFGVAVRSAEVVRWRMSGASPADLSQFWLTFGAVIALVGFLCTIREISKPLYGNAPWIWTLVAMAIYTAGASSLRFL